MRTFNANDGMEDFVGAFAALDGVLNMVRGDGVRLLTVISDGHYKGTQTRGCQEAVTRFIRSGRHVLRIGQPDTIFPDGVIPLVIDTREVEKVPEADAEELNDRPRKRLEFQKPIEVIGDLLLQ